MSISVSPRVFDCVSIVCFSLRLRKDLRDIFKNQAVCTRLCRENSDTRMSHLEPHGPAAGDTRTTKLLSKSFQKYQPAAKLDIFNTW